jgi:hypothetical protein
MSAFHKDADREQRKLKVLRTADSKTADEQERANSIEVRIDSDVRL